MFLADYRLYNATTFDPLYKTKNYGIDAVKNETAKALEDYHKNGTAATQADMVGHSMGGLLIRGFAQQPNYKALTNFMKGSIHRLITIGTPHFGSPLASILLNNRTSYYCHSFTMVKGKFFEFLLYPRSDTKDCKHPQSLETIYSEIGAPIEQGGVEALIPGSMAYSHLCPTYIHSYSIVGSWQPNGTSSHDKLERLFQNITGNSTFKLEQDGFHSPNDLQVNLTSQAGGIYCVIRQDRDSNIPNGSETYLNTVHAWNFIADDGLSYEMGSGKIMKEVLVLLNSPTSKFASSIGNGTHCDVPENPVSIGHSSLNRIEDIF